VFAAQAAAGVHASGLTTANEFPNLVFYDTFDSGGDAALDAENYTPQLGGILGTAGGADRTGTWILAADGGATASIDAGNNVLLLDCEWSDYCHISWEALLTTGANASVGMCWAVRKGTNGNGRTQSTSVGTANARTAQENFTITRRWSDADVNTTSTTADGTGPTAHASTWRSFDLYRRGSEIELWMDGTLEHSMTMPLEDNAMLTGDPDSEGNNRAFALNMTGSESAAGQYLRNVAIRIKPA
jgi:hypothetical protein